MSKDIFLADYSNCDDTIREIGSNIYYLEEIKSLVDSVTANVSNASVPSYIWDKSNLLDNVNTLKSYINDEINRYENFKPKFVDFYSQIEPLDIGLKDLINNQLKYIEDNKDYNTYITILKFNQEDEVQEKLYDLLINQGLPKEVALKISLLYDMETQRILSELEKLNESELKKKLEEIHDKAVKSPEELLIIEILSLDKGSSHAGNVKELADIVSSGAIAAFMHSKYIGKDLSMYKLDINSIQGQINKLTSTIRRSQLSKAKVNLMEEQLVKLKNIRSAKLSNVNKITTFNKVQNYTGKVAKWAGRAALAFQVCEITKEQWDEYTKNGVELDDVIVAAGIDVSGIVAAGAIGGKVGGALGTAIGGLIGAGVGGVVGITVGILVGFLYGVVVDPILTDIYNKVLEPGLEWTKYRANDIEDWWDTLWW